MPQLLTDFFDYNRTVIGYHGTTQAFADRLVAGDDFISSDSEDEWLGHGICFWEYAPKQAWWWSRKVKKFKEPAVVGAMIRLGNCFDLLDPTNLIALKEMHTGLIDTCEGAGVAIPENARQYRDLDCAVFNYLYKEAAERKSPIDSARGVYVPTDQKKRIWKGSWIYDHAHIQICIRNTKNILAVWHVRQNGRYGKTEE